MFKFLNIAFFVLLISCSGTKNMPVKTVDQTQHEEFIIISQGGGFTGVYESYMIKSTGDVFQINAAEKDSLQIGKLNGLINDSLFTIARSLNFSEATNTAPGNMTYRIMVNLEDRKQEVSWADDAKQKKDILLFFEYAFLEVKRLKI